MILIKKTVILGFFRSKNCFIPIVKAYPRTDGCGLCFWCDYCHRLHLHGFGNGHRSSHCHDSHSPFDKTGYILQSGSVE